MVPSRDISLSPISRRLNPPCSPSLLLGPSVVDHGPFAIFAPYGVRCFPSRRSLALFSRFATCKLASLSSCELASCSHRKRSSMPKQNWLSGEGGGGQHRHPQESSFFPQANAAQGCFTKETIYLAMEVQCVHTWAHRRTSSYLHVFRTYTRIYLPLKFRISIGQGLITHCEPEPGYIRVLSKTIWQLSISSLHLKNFRDGFARYAYRSILAWSPQSRVLQTCCQAS